MGLVYTARLIRTPKDILLPLVGVTPGLFFIDIRAVAEHGVLLELGGGGLVLNAVTGIITGPVLGQDVAGATDEIKAILAICWATFLVYGGACRR